MKLLSVATEERRPGVCPKCEQVVELAKFRAFGAFVAGRPHVQGVYWAPAVHDCKPVARGLTSLLRSMTGEREA